MCFQKYKNDILNKPDKSNEGKLDERIIGLCQKINSNNNYFTTSSCSGRITLIKSTDKKIKDVFLFKTHEKITLEQLKQELEKATQEKELIYFKSEPCALHVSCKEMNVATNLLMLARQAGWKKSGIFSNSKDKKIICQLFSTQFIEMPIIKDNKILIDDNFLEVLVEEANKRLEKSWKRIEMLKLFLN